MKVDDEQRDDSGSERLAEFQDRITDRLPTKRPVDGTSGPDRQDEERITSVLPEEPPEQRPPGLLRIGEIVAGRYCIEHGPIGLKTGEAEIYRGLDRSTQGTVILKYYRNNFTPKKEVLDNLVKIDHPNLVALRTYGEWGGHFFEVQEYCAGGVITDLIPLTEGKIKKYLGQIVNGLKFCHDQGIIHRDIKPSNLLFRDAERTELAIGDFGISSYLPDGQTDQVTRTYMFFTLDYASPEQLRLRQVGPPTDYYSLGITLIHLLLGRSPFTDMVYHEIVDTHLQGKALIPKGLSERLELLLSGLLRRHPAGRWGYDQVRAYLNDEPIVEDVFFDKELPYPKCTLAANPRELAGCLEKFDAKEELFHGRISLWAEFFDTDLAARISRIENDYADNPAMGVFKLKYMLDSDLPLKIQDEDIYDMVQLYQALRSRNKPVRVELGKAFWAGFIDCWIETAFQGPRGLELANNIKTFREKYADHRSMGAIPLIYLLDPATPLKIGPKVMVQTPEELAAAMQKSSAVRDLAVKYLAVGLLEAWMEISFPDRIEDREFFSQWSAWASGHRELVSQVIIWRYDPSEPFDFYDNKIATPKELAAVIDGGAIGWKRGVEYLENGWIGAWLITTGMLPDPAAFNRVMDDENLGQDLKLEMILHLLDPDLPPPVMTVDKESLDLGDIIPGERAAADLVFRNNGRGHLEGIVYLDHESHELTIIPNRIIGPEARVWITGQPPHWIKTEVSRKLNLIAETNGGWIEIPVVYTILKKKPMAIEQKPIGFFHYLGSFVIILLVAMAAIPGDILFAMGTLVFGLAAMWLFGTRFK